MLRRKLAALGIALSATFCLTMPVFAASTTAVHIYLNGVRWIMEMEIPLLFW